MSYTRYETVIPQSSTDHAPPLGDERSVPYHCRRCGVRTSGIILDITDPARTCPICRDILSGKIPKQPPGPTNGWGRK